MVDAVKLKLIDVVLYVAHALDSDCRLSLFANRDLFSLLLLD